MRDLKKEIHRLLRILNGNLGVPITLKEITLRINSDANVREILTLNQVSTMIRMQRRYATFYRKDSRIGITEFVFFDNRPKKRQRRY